MEVLQLSDYRIPPPEKTKAKSQYELYPLPFFNRGKRCTWDVTPSGNYSVDCDTGQAFAIEFLKSCDKTNGWASLMQSIVADMIRAGPSGSFANGCPKVNGIVIGFMGVIGGGLAHTRKSWIDEVAQLEPRRFTPAGLLPPRAFCLIC
jgi:hypothetical protein